MNFSENTLQLLKNFADINPRMCFKKGNAQSTISPQNTIQSTATIAEAIPQDFTISDLNVFLSIFTLQNEPQLQFDDKHVFILGNKGRSKITYRCAVNDDKPRKPVNLPKDWEIKFSITEVDFNEIMKAAAVLRSPNLAIVGDGTNYTIKAFDVHDDAAHSDSLDLGPCPPDSLSTCNILYITQNWKMIPGDYDVSISLHGITRFIHKTRNLEYLLSQELNTNR